MTGDRPLASVIVPVFKHHPYLEPAIESVLKLDYEPLEIVIRDDASPDDAYDVLKRLVSAYRGPHQVKLARNESNMSMGNYNRLMEDASAQYIIVAHDDDLQLPQRVSQIIDAFVTHGVSMVTSNMINIDADGEETGIQLERNGDRRVAVSDLARRGWMKTLDGAALSWNREIFNVFGPIDIDSTARTSDWILPFRAGLLDGIHYLDEPLLRKRVHLNSRRHIGRAREDRDVNHVELASENIAQISYMIQTLKYFSAKGCIEQSESAKLRSFLSENLEDYARMLATNRNRLHMKNLRMAWLDRDLGQMIDPERLGDLEHVIAEMRTSRSWRVTAPLRQFGDLLRSVRAGIRKLLSSSLPNA